MRITNNMMANTYIRNLNKNAEQVDDMNQRMSSGKKFLSMSEDPATSLRAFRVRRNIDELSYFTSTISDAKGTLDEAENSIKAINDIVTDCVTQVTQGKNGTYNATQRKTIASTLRGYQKQIFSAVNAQYNGDYVFGGKTTDIIPFTLDASGNLFFKGQNVDTGTFGEESRYVDVGLGLQYDADGNVVKNTAFDISNSGVDLLGKGVDANGISNNLYNVIGKIANMFDNNDLTDIEKYATKLNEKADDIRTSYSSIGERGSFVNFLSDRYNSSVDTLSAKDKELEGLDYAKASIEMSQDEFAYSACLQIGTKILQNSLLDYLN